jgi:hypothetical protein
LFIDIDVRQGGLPKIHDGIAAGRGEGANRPESAYMNILNE